MKKAATIIDVAKRAAVSTATVSAVLNSSAHVSPELTERVRAAVAELNYTPNAVARGLQTRCTQTIGMLVPDIAEPVYSEMVKGVEYALRAAGYSLLIAATHNDPAEQSKHLDLLRSRRVDGLLVFLAFGGEDEIREMVEAGMPLVFIAREPAGFPADCVIVDNVKATRAAVGHLAAQGHRKIGLIVGAKRLKVSQDRMRGWREALGEAGLPVDDAYIAEGDYTTPSGVAAMQGFLELEEPPTAVFATGFLMMTGCLKHLREHGLRVPDDVELMTWSDTPLLDIFDPPISTVQQPSFEMGRQAGELALSRIRDRTAPPRRVVLPTTLKIRR